MSMDRATWASSATDLWATPQDFYDDLHAEFGFSLDVCATPDNAKCPRYFTAEHDGLAAMAWRVLDEPALWPRDWQLDAEGLRERQRGRAGGLPRPEPHRYALVARLRHEGRSPLRQGQVRDSKNSAPFPLAVVVFRPEAT
jgi:hypothetical protein